MSDKLAAAREIRMGAERLRQIAMNEAEAERAAEMLRLAKEMDEHATELERSIADASPRQADTAA